MEEDGGNERCEVVDVLDENVESCWVRQGKRENSLFSGPRIGLGRISREARECDDIDSDFS